MSTSAIGSSKSLNGKTIGITATAAVIVLAIIGWTAGWFGGSEPAPAPAATTTEQPAAQGTAPAAPAAGQQSGGTTSTTP